MSVSDNILEAFMKKNIFLFLLLGYAFLLTACEFTPIEPGSSNGGTQLENTLRENTNDTDLAETNSTDMDSTETNSTDVDASTDTNNVDAEVVLDQVDSSDREPLPTSSDNTSGYHDLLSPIDPAQLGLTPEMIMENQGLLPLLEHLITVQYNYSYGEIGYVEEADSIYVLSNKLNHLPADYVPNDLVEPNIPFYFSEALEKKKLRSEAATHMEELFAAANEAGYNLLGASGYRSYATQKGIYENNVANRGLAATDKVSARPGHSEHQTGLALDVTLESLSYRLVDALGEMDEGLWLKENAHQYGFIIRYPKEDTSITGYSYEPWHLRYIGQDVATFIYTHDLTVEELYVYIESLIEENTGL
jgi:D-alanyl-D-alanine carboxypeptidase